MPTSAVRLRCGIGVWIAMTVGASPGFSQVTQSRETPLRAVGPDAARRQASPPDSQTSYYANVLPAQSGDANIDRVDAIPGYQFTAIKLIASVAPAVFAAAPDISGEQASGKLGALRHLNMHVTIRALDGSGQPVDPQPSDPVALATLEISPSEPAFADRVGNTAAAISTAVTDASSKFLPTISRIFQTFQASYHRRPAATQVSYMTGPNAFGWRWYESADETIEGLHYATVLLQVANEIKSVRMTVDLVAEWRAFGLWSRSFEFTYILPRPPS